MNILIVVLGQLPEAIFFALFMILAKNIKKKILLFTGLMCLEYVLIMMLFQYNWLFHIIYTIMTFLTLKVLYKENAQITDIFILMISYIILIVTSAICAVIFNSNLVIATITNRIIIFGLLIIFKNKFSKIQNLYKTYWNRNTIPKKITGEKIIQ